MKMNKQRLDLKKLPKKDAPSLVSILSGKGGAGKSIIAFNLTCALARGGFKCLLIDADWDFGNLHILTNTIPGMTLSDMVEGRVSGPMSVTGISDQIQMIASPSVAGVGKEFNAVKYARFLENIRTVFQSYDFILFDTPSGRPDLIALTAAASDMKLLIVNPDLASLANNYGLLKLLLKSNQQMTAHILVNRAHSGKDSEYIYQKLAVLTGRYLNNIPVYAGYVNADQWVTDSVLRQKSLLDSATESVVADQILTLSRFVTGELIGENKNKRINASLNINSEILSADIKE